MCQEVVIALCESPTDDTSLEVPRKITRNLHQESYTSYEPNTYCIDTSSVSVIIG